MNLNTIHSPSDLKKMSVSELVELCPKLREVLLRRLSHKGGHIGPNLGFLEATVALHYVFDAPSDKIVFDVSHQTYVHKMLTGRMYAFTDQENYNKVSGYSNPDESEYDLFTIGHTSTAVSLAGGLAKARDLTGGDENIVAVIGDGSLSGGEAFEGLDSAGERGGNFIVVVNDNGMSIAENHGGLYRNLELLRETNGTAECNYFKALGFEYIYVPYGNDVASLVEAFKSVKDTRHPVVVHLNTQKGYGYAPAEANREAFHYGAPFDLATGNPTRISDSEDYGDIFCKYMTERVKRDPRTVVLTAGTPGAIGFGAEDRKKLGDNFIDTGIAEQDAVSMGAGLAKSGMNPCFGVVSSFLQRTYDQLSQDVGINKLPLTLNICYGSVAGMNDSTHLGWWDIALVSNIPGWIYLAPTNCEEYLAMLDWALDQKEHPVAVRVPGFGVRHADRPVCKDYSNIGYEKVIEGSRVAIIAAGGMYHIGEETAALLREAGITPTLINPRCLSIIDKTTLDSLKDNHSLVVTIEDGCLDGGFGEKIARYYGASEIKTLCYGLPKKFADRYRVKELLAECRMTPDLIMDDIIRMLG